MDAERKVKTSIFIEKRLWEEFKRKIALERGSRKLSEALEEALKEELSDTIILEALKNLIPPETVEEVKPVRPKVKTSAGEAVRELRRSREG